MRLPLLATLLLLGCGSSVNSTLAGYEMPAFPVMGVPGSASVNLGGLESSREVLPSESDPDVDFLVQEAQTELPSGPITELQARRLYAGRSPRVRSEWQRFQAARHAYSQTRYLGRLVAEYRSLAGRPERRKVPLGQSVHRLEAAVVAADIRVARVRYESSVWSGLVALTRAFHAYRADTRAARLLQDNVNLATSLLQSARARSTTNKASGVDVVRAEMRLAEAKKLSIDARQRVHAASERLGAFIGATGARAGIPTPIPPTPSVARLKEWLSKAPSVRMAVSRRDRAAAVLALAERMVLPEQTLRSAEGQRSARQGGAPTYTVGQPFIAELRDRLGSAEARLADVRRQTLASLRTRRELLSEAKRAERLLRRTLLPKAERVLQLTEADYRVGRASYLMLNDAHRIWLETTLAGLNAQRDAHIAAAALSAELGMRLEIR